MAQKILRIVIESKVNIPPSSLEKEKKSSEILYEKKKLKIFMALNSVLTLWESSYT